MGRRHRNPEHERDPLHEFDLALRNLARALGRVRRFFENDNDELMEYYPVIAEYALSFDTRVPSARSSSERGGESARGLIDLKCQVRPPEVEDRAEGAD